MSNIFKTNIWNKIRYTVYLPVYNITVALLDNARKRSIDLARIQTDEKILIVGGGTGLDLVHLQHCRNITITDITPAMVSKAERLSGKLNMNVNAQVMDGQKMSFPDNSFDVVILHLILAVIPNPYMCILESERVLKPGGRIAVLDKFLQKEKPGLIRRIINPFSIFFFTDINRRLKDILSVTNLKIIHEEPSLLNGFFRIYQLRKEI